MRPLRFASLLGLLLSVSCGLLDTSDPDTVNPGDLDTPEGAESRRLGAISQFTFAKDGDASGASDGSGINDGLVNLSGLLADEFMHATTPPSEQEIDQRGATILNPTTYGLYLELHRARTSAEHAASALTQFSVDGSSDPGVAEMLSLAGFTYLYFAENFCGAVPYSELNGTQVIYGTPATRDSSLRIALARFDSALASPGLTPEIDGLARVGKARALLNLDPSDATIPTWLTSVPTDFVYESEHAESPARLQNQVLVSGRDGLFSVANLEGGNGFGFRDAADPRAPFDSTGSTGLDGITELFSITKYPDASSPTPVANGIEARLIEAEVELNIGSIPNMSAILDTLRASIGLAPLPAPASTTEAQDQLFSERALWLFATGHRLGDLRRIARPPYNRPVNTIFPIGSYSKGGNYSDQVTLLIPQEVQNNPNYDPSQCDATVP